MSLPDFLGAAGSGAAPEVSNPSVRCRALMGLVGGGGGVPEASVSKDTVRLTSDAFVVVRDVASAAPAVVIADVARQTVSRQGTSGADSASMCPRSRLVALQSGAAVQVFDLRAKKRVASCELSSPPVHVAWLLGGDKLALVTKGFVYHWTIGTGDAAAPTKPKKVFERDAALGGAGATVVSYTTDASEAWMMLVAWLDPAKAKGGSGSGGVVQLYSAEKKSSKVLPGITAGTLAPHKGALLALLAGSGRVTALELPTRAKPTTTYEKKVSELPPATGAPEADGEARASSPVFFMHVTPEGFLVSATGGGTLYLHDVVTNALLTQADTGRSLLAAAPLQTAAAAAAAAAGAVCVDAAGRVVALEFDLSHVVGSVLRQSFDEAFVLEIGGRARVPEALQMYADHFRALVAAGHAQEAVTLAAGSPGGCLRTAETLRALRSFPQIPGEPPALMVFLRKVLERPAAEGGVLSETESLELARLTLPTQNGGEGLRRLLAEDRLTASEALGARLEPVDAAAALDCYARCGAHARVLALHVRRRSFSDAVAYILATRAAGGWADLDWAQVVGSVVAESPEGGLEFALALPRTAAAVRKGSVIAPVDVVALLLEHGCVKEATRYLLSVLDGKFEGAEGEAEEALYQTTLFEMNLKHSAPQVIEALFAHGKYTKYDSLKIAELCRDAGLHLRALKLYAKVHLTSGGQREGVVSCAVAAAATALEYLPNLLWVLPPDDATALVSAMVAANPRGVAGQVVDSLLSTAPSAAAAAAPVPEKKSKKSKAAAAAATATPQRVVSRLDAAPIVAVFVEHGAHDCLLRLAKVLVLELKSTSAEVHTAAVQCAVREGDQGFLEELSRTSACYDVERCLEAIESGRGLVDPWPHINVCHRHGLWGRMVAYLATSRSLHYLTLYLTEKAPDNTAAVVAALLENSATAADHHFLLSTIRKVSPTLTAPGPIVQAVAATGQIAFVVPWMEQLVVEHSPAYDGAGKAAGGQTTCNDRVVVEALARYYLETGKPPPPPEDAAAAAAATAAATPVLPVQLLLQRKLGSFDGRALGAYAEERGFPRVAHLCYVAAWTHPTAAAAAAAASASGEVGGTFEPSVDETPPTTPSFFTESRTSSVNGGLTLSNFGDASEPVTPAEGVGGGGGGSACDDEVIALCLKHRMLEELGTYLLQRECLRLWLRVLGGAAPAESGGGRERKEALIDVVVGTVLPRVTDAKQLSVAVKAFTQAGLPERLTAFLETLILNSPTSPFAQNKFLQNLLMLNVMKTAPDRVMEFVTRLDKYDPDAMARILLKNGHNEEALQVYKVNRGGELNAMRILCGTIGDLARAETLAAELDLPECFRVLGQAYLQKGRLAPAMRALSRAKDHKLARHIVAEVAKEAAAASSPAEEEAVLRLQTELVPYLAAARAACTDGSIDFLSFADTESAYHLGVTGQTTELSHFVAAPHLANLTVAGDRCCKAEKYEAACVLYTSGRNYPSLASTLMVSKKFLEALDAAQKANDLRTWGAVCFGCVRADELSLAQMAAQHLIVVPDELAKVRDVFEEAGRLEEYRKLLFTGVANERAHVGVYTELARVLCAFFPKELQPYLELYHERVNRALVLPGCAERHLWREVVFLQGCDGDYERALGTMLDHPSQAWTHEACTALSLKVASASPEVLYAAVRFYAELHPDLLCEYLFSVSSRVLPDKVVMMLQADGRWHLARAWLLATQQTHDTTIVNGCVNTMLLEEEDYAGLKESLASHRNFDKASLCPLLESHDLLELRRVAAWIHAGAGRHQRAVELCLADRLFTDAAAYAAESRSEAVVQSLLRYYMKADLPECFAAVLCDCYELVEPDVALELAWRHGKHEMVMPYLCQVLKDLWADRRARQGTSSLA